MSKSPSLILRRMSYTLYNVVMTMTVMVMDGGVDGDGGDGGVGDDDDNKMLYTQIFMHLILIFSPYLTGCNDKLP